MISLLQSNSISIPLPDKSVQCCITSPPFFGLRKYKGVEPTCWPSVTFTPVSGLQPMTIPEQTCCLGLEDNPWSYVGHLVAIFREVKRVLRDDGIVFLNLGDSYSGYHGNSKRNDSDAPSNKPGYIENMRSSSVGISGLKPKDLIGIPHRVAFALQADGWYLRSDIVWAKPNPMPESVRDRPTKSHEYVFLLTKRARYYWDQEAVREGNRVYTRKAGGYGGAHIRPGRDITRNEGGLADRDTTTVGRNIRTVWTVTTRGFAGAHFATFPPKLVEPMVKAGTSEKGCCPVCGAAWERVVAVSGESTTDKRKRLSYSEKRGGGGVLVRQNLDYAGGHGTNTRDRTTTGFHPACDHDAEPIPCTVLDPFCGSGTTGLVSIKHNRSFVGLDLSHHYLSTIAKGRIDGVQRKLF